MLLPRPKPFIFCGVDLWGVYYLKFLIHPQTVLQGEFQGSKGMNAIQSPSDTISHANSDQCQTTYNLKIFDQAGRKLPQEKAIISSQ
jgi:hypothetical protein